MTVENHSSILVVSSKVDIATDYVILKLQELDSDVVRINTEDFPLASKSSFKMSGALSRPSVNWITPMGKRLDLQRLRSVWFRRHRLPRMPGSMGPADEEYCLREADWFVKGVLYSFTASEENLAWMNHPSNAQFAESKIYQLTVANSLGLKIPSTLVSNNPEEIREFFDECSGSVIAKPLRLGYFDHGDRQTCVYTVQIRREDLADNSPLQLAPVIYQGLISKKCDVRVTVVGDRLFAAAIDSQSVPSAVTDWRQADTGKLPHAVHTLPDSIQAKCLELMQALGLSYGAIDLILTPENEYVFLEINPGGQLVWLEDRLSFPISATIANWLRFAGKE